MAKKHTPKEFRFKHCNREWGTISVIGRHDITSQCPDCWTVVNVHEVRTLDDTQEARVNGDRNALMGFLGKP